MAKGLCSKVKKSNRSGMRVGLVRVGARTSVHCSKWALLAYLLTTKLYIILLDFCSASLLLSSSSSYLCITIFFCKTTIYQIFISISFLQPKLDKLQKKSGEALNIAVNASGAGLSSLLSQLNPLGIGAIRTAPVVRIEESAVGAYQPKGGGMDKGSSSRNGGKKRVARKMSRHNKAFP